jgi:hypothetical protein
MLERLVRLTPQQLQEWETIRTRGKRNYVVWHGIVRWGGLMYAVMSIFMLLRNSGGLSLRDIGVLLASGVVIWLLAGMVFGIWTWSMMETAYRHARQQQRKG